MTLDSTETAQLPENEPSAASEMPSTIPELHSPRSESDFRPPSLLRVAASASLYLFLGYFSFAMSFTPLAVLWVHRACASVGLSASECTPKMPDGSDNERYLHAQSEAASSSVYYTLFTGIPSVLTCAIFGCLGDSYGRRIPLLMPLAGMVMQGFVWGLTPSNEWAIGLNTALSTLGGIYVCNMGVFSSLADATMNSSTEHRTLAFGMVEGVLWVGLLLGPITGGLMVHFFGAQKAFLCSAGIGVANFLLTLLTYPETLEEGRKRQFSWHRANPFVSVRLFSTSRTTVLLGLVMLMGLSSQSGGSAWLGLYAQGEKFGLSATMLGILQSTLLGASVVGLLIAMPLLVRCISLPKLLIMACCNACICWTLMSLADKAWQLYAIAATSVLAALFFPIVRCGMANTFGKARYGEALAAVGVIEQLCNMLGAPIINGVYAATQHIHFTVGNLEVYTLAPLTAAAMYSIALVAGAFLKHIPHEGVPDESSSTSFLSDCRDARTSALPAQVSPQGQ